MRPRTFILLILVLLVLAVVAVLVFLNFSGGQGGVDQGPEVIPPEETAVSQEEPGIPPPTPTPALRLEPVIIAKVDLPIGERIRSDLIDVEMRPNNNIALQGGYTFSDPSEVVGKIARVPIAKGQEILRPMLAFNPSDLAAFGSDLSLYVDQGKVAVAFPIDKLSGAAYALRPGDLVDVMMSLSLVKLDPEFQTRLPNRVERVNELALLEGQSFLFPPATEGRLELIPEINLVAEIVPGQIGFENQAPEEVGRQLPRRVTQLTIQQAEVLWVGTWQDPRLQEEESAVSQIGLEGSETGIGEGETDTGETDGFETGPAPTPIPQRSTTRPDVVILSMTAQDALALKWALENGVKITLALRAQGDNTVFVTTSVSLPQLVEQGGLKTPEESEFGLQPPITDIVRPSLPTEQP
ncbi:MAG: hypothetical protein D6706_05010 [Chloroflexi bacterium]|nr:MAG: hypothetical protein D6706_05010 [Chloroflexota bacterium]